MIKKTLLIIAILFACSAVKSQGLHDKEYWKNYYSTLYKLGLTEVFTENSDSLIVVLPVKFEQSVTITCAITEPPKSFTVQLETPIDQIKQKSSPRQDLKTKIGGLIVIGSAIYIFRDDLQKWGNRNDKLAHLFLSYGLTKFFGWKFALGFMLSVEATQTDIFGIGDRYEDTIEDIFVDSWGIVFAWKF